MNFTSSLSGAAFAYLFVNGVVAVLPEAPFLEVHSVTYQGGEVITDRTINGPETPADWQVSVVAVDRAPPSCSTVKGPELHQGWSHYAPSPRAKKKMPLDIWVGDKGCYDRLTSGDYSMHMTWTPRDGQTPVSAIVKITIEKDEE